MSNLKVSVSGGSTSVALLARIQDFLRARGVTGYVVGGYVRDSLLGRPCADIDIAIEAPALEVARAFADVVGGRFIGLHEAHAVARVVLYPGREVVDFSTLQGSLEADLLRRDFTINAMAIDLEDLSPASGQLPIIDPWGGQRDLETGLLRAVTPQAFEADPGRLLRAVRLAAEYGLTIERGTEEQIRSSALLVSGVAGERLREELVRLLSLPRAAAPLAYLDRLGLLLVLVPELAEAKGCLQPPEHYWDVFDHSLKTVEAVEKLLAGEISGLSPLTSQLPFLTSPFGQTVGTTPRHALLKLASLLHDIAKPQTRSVEPTGRIRFLGHAAEGANIAAAVLERWRFSHREIKLVEAMVTHHLRPAQMAQADQLPSHRAIYRYFRDVGEAAIDTLFLSLADHWATRGPKLIPQGWAAHTAVVSHILEEHFRQECLTQPPKLVDGHDLMALFGLKPGPALGRLLEALREAQAAGEIATREQALAWVKRQLDIGRGDS